LGLRCTTSVSEAMLAGEVASASSLSGTGPVTVEQPASSTARARAVQQCLPVAH
jgi:hypothetical protein